MLATEEMDGDEVVFMLIAAGITFFGCVFWYTRLLGSPVLGRRPPFFTSLILTPPACMLVLLWVLLKWSDPVVANDIRYIGLFLFGGGAFLTLAMMIMRLLGVHRQIDVLQQRNPAAALVTIGCMFGVILAYSLANIGVGPTIWTTIGPAILATASFFLLWALIELISRVSEAITIERDVASGLRLAAFLIVAGLILGRAVAGDYQSAEATMRDFFKQAWPVLPLSITVGILQRVLRATPRLPQPPAFSHGLVPAILYALFAAGWVAYLGKW